MNWTTLGRMPSKSRSHICIYHKIDILIGKLAKQVINFVENMKIMTIKNAGDR